MQYLNSKLANREIEAAGTSTDTAIALALFAVTIDDHWDRLNFLNQYLEDKNVPDWPEYHNFKEEIYHEACRIIIGDYMGKPGDSKPIDKWGYDSAVIGHEWPTNDEI